MDGARRFPTRLSIVSLVALLAVAATAGAAGGRSSTVTITAAPHRVVQGNRVAFAAYVSPAGTRCSIAVRYAGGSTQRGLGARLARNGSVTWSWTVPRTARPGAASVRISCGSAGSAARRMMVIGQLLPLKIKVVKTGFSIRPLPYAGTRVSYGVILENESKTENADRVSVLVNFVMADNRLIGSTSTNLTQIRADTQHAVGGDVTFPAEAPIARLEVVVQAASRSPRVRRVPAISSVRVVADVYQPAWVGSVEGELANDDTSTTLTSSRLTAVVFDAAGNVLGGGSGYASASLPPGAREFFKIVGGSAIPIGKAHSALVSVEPLYAQAPPT
jgi:hypothetical protein